MRGLAQAAFRPCLSCGHSNRLDEEVCSRCGTPLEARAGRTALHVPTRRERLGRLLHTYRHALYIGMGGGVLAVALMFLVALGLQDSGGAGEETSAAQEAEGPSGPAAPKAAAASGGPEGGEAPPGEAPPAEGLAAEIDGSVREAGFEPRLLKAFSQRSGGPEDAVLLGLQGMDRESFHRLLGVVTARFRDLDGSGEEPALGRVSLVLTDSLGVVRKHEIQRGDGLKAAASADALQAMAERFGIATYPEPETDLPSTAPLERSHFQAPGQPAAPEGDEGPDAPSGPEEEEEEGAANEGEREPGVQPELRYTPTRARVEVLRLMVRSRFPEVVVEDTGDSVVVRGPEATLEDVRLFLEQVDNRTGKR